ncbi:hypothetical protein [Jiulongibacter sediminis]|jgi:hypothetical protein|uniref:hypothetical protein n=1 Tax=Jiulongibacter sediminis TaxID=1605367 RepID=UPI0026F28D91|nr:hypothetical protein [Jiulongibacter sediminis]
MKKQLKLLTITGLCLALFSCNMKTEEQAELEKLRALDSLRNEMNQSVSANPDVDFYSPDYEPSEPVAYKPEEKKMSAATKGALIGAGAGAASGAVIDGKKPVRGAVLGGVLGAGAGAATGAIIEKKKRE